MLHVTLSGLWATATNFARHRNWLSTLIYRAEGSVSCATSRMPLLATGPREQYVFVDVAQAFGPPDRHFGCSRQSRIWMFSRVISWN